MSERGALESGLGSTALVASSAVQSAVQPIVYPEKRKKRTIKEFRAEKERNQRTFYNLKGIGRGLELVLNDVPCEFTVLSFVYHCNMIPSRYGIILQDVMT